ncbi:hypothetical protein K0M31_016139 [Melipona bicolor]|uniref:Uncharacterized protein n=1 Tax=Melipona bicolor TaxID=60889 RepID=A0AA40KTE2_9HYME|nr:hypothetical protein K0M31_016139 [Melipona bicolor]
MDQPTCSELEPILKSWVEERRGNLDSPFLGESRAQGGNKSESVSPVESSTCSGELSSRHECAKASWFHATSVLGRVVFTAQPVFGRVGFTLQPRSRCPVQANQNSREHTAHLERLAFETKCYQFSAGPPPSSTGRMHSPAAGRFTNPSAAPTDRARVMSSFPRFRAVIRPSV